MTTDVLLYEREREHTHTLVFDVEVPWLLHELFRSSLYQSHVRHRVDVDVALLTEAGDYAVAKLTPTDGVENRDFEDYFDPPDRPHDKSSVVFRSDLRDVEALKPAVVQAAEAAVARKEATG